MDTSLLSPEVCAKIDAFEVPEGQRLVRLDKAYHPKPEDCCENCPFRSEGIGCLDAYGDLSSQYGFDQCFEVKDFSEGPFYFELVVVA